MEVISLHGTEDRLYELVARLVMNPDIIRQNNNYPFKTTPQHIWYICMCDGEVVGFMPVKTTSAGMNLSHAQYSRSTTGCSMWRKKEEGVDDTQAECIRGCAGTP